MDFEQLMMLPLPMLYKTRCAEAALNKYGQGYRFPGHALAVMSRSAAGDAAYSELRAIHLSRAAKTTQGAGIQRRRIASGVRGQGSGVRSVGSWQGFAGRSGVLAFAAGLD
jgi:hypothetical protein